MRCCRRLLELARLSRCLAGLLLLCTLTIDSYNDGEIWQARAEPLARCGLIGLAVATRG